ncbi:MAG: RagB/SusD family nutrient uptake outer membrane protein, partial [Methanomicrobiales archaeon]|nr:RagB/SusD family nutrient uptake outer membrane protein [Methanomicrobiales archaeon]
RQSDNVHYFPQTYDEKKWAVAAAACKRVIDMDYTLHTVEASYDTPELPQGITHDPNYYKDWPEGAAGIDPYRSYADMFNGETLGFKNREYVFGKNSSRVRASTELFFPGPFGGWNCVSVPQKIIDAYKMVDGRGINNSSGLYPYTETGFTTRDQAFSGYTLKPNVNLMYINREPRFYASIGFSGCLWPMNSTTETGKFMVQIFYARDGNSGRSAVRQGDMRNYPITGYVPKKYVHPDDAWSGANSTILNKSFPIVRYSDILLMYAESLSNLTESHTITNEDSGDSQTFYRDVNEIKWAFNLVRYRSGLPGLTEEEASSHAAFFEVLKTERMVEFLHEGLRYHDVRRWGIVKEEEAIPIMGMDTEKTERDGYYNRVICNYSGVRNREFKDKMILLPIDRQEIKRVRTLDQNPGWED